MSKPRRPHHVALLIGLAGGVALAGLILLGVDAWFSAKVGDAGMPAASGQAARQSVSPADSATAAQTRLPQPPGGATPATDRLAQAGQTAFDPSRVPPGISALQWTALRAEMAQRPDGQAELQRLAAWFAFNDLAQRLRAQRQAGNDAARLAALAAEVDSALPERVRQRELSAGEARQLKLAVLEAQFSDPVERERHLQQWQQALAAEQAAARGPQAAAAQQREQAFLAQQASLVAAWQAQPAAQRQPGDERQLQQQLEMLRRDSFPGPTR